MAVYLPTAAVGNGHCLSTLGASGEIMTFFYPHIDFAQNIRECLPLIYAGRPGHGKLIYTFEDTFTSEQRYLPDTAIVETILEASDPALTVDFTDFCPAGDGEKTAALIRRVEIENTGSNTFVGSFGHYFHLFLGEVCGKQAVRYDHEKKRFLQYFRSIGLAVGGAQPDLIRCGKANFDDHRSAKTDLQDGHLNGQPEDIGQVDFASLHRMRLAPGERYSFWMCMAFDSEWHLASDALDTLQDIGPQKLQSDTVDYWNDFLADRRVVDVPEKLASAYRQALVMLGILQDAQAGSFVAAPEFDPQYERCGGYGYCWPRDASEAAEAMAAAGYDAAEEHLVKWYAKAQEPDGLWGQRHWADGPIASSWSVRNDFRQLDQSAAALRTVSQWALAHKDDGEMPEMYPVIRRAAQQLHHLVDEEGFHGQACDLWETYCGVFVYTNAAIAAALEAAARCAEVLEDATLAERWEGTARKMREAIIDLFNGSYFPRGKQQTGHPDDTIDTATFGLVEPFRALDLSDQRQREMALTNLQTVENTLGRDLDGGRGLRRYEGDAYLGGSIGCVNTLWAAQVRLTLALELAAEDAEQARELAEGAAEYMQTALNHATPAGCLPELMAAPDVPYWAAPHAWASALMVRCVLLYHEYLATAGEPPVAANSDR
ncbi:MAG: glycoside hydrolase family 15 protein [Armatimonadota bacterium]